MEYNCQKCKHVTASSRVLQEHYDKAQVDTNLKCSQCDYATTSDDSLKVHFKEHESNDAQSLDEDFVVENATLKKELRALFDIYGRISVLLNALEAETKTDANDNKKKLWLKQHCEKESGLKVAQKA